MNCILLYFVAIVTACAAIDLGYVENFAISDIGPDYIELTWDFVQGDSTYPLHKYSLTTDSDLTTQFKCSKPTCSRTIEYLEPCIEHVFDLKPIFSNPISGGDIDGEKDTTTGYTTDELPGPVSNIHVTGDSDDATTFEWNPPTVNEKCVNEYDVCLRQDGETDTVCVKASSTLVTAKELVACAQYHVTVTPLTFSGMKGEHLSVVITTRDGVPGMPENVVVGLTTSETIELLWDLPKVNPLCVERFVVTIGQTDAEIVTATQRRTYETDAEIVTAAQRKTYDKQMTFSPLLPCTNYTIDICSANAAEEESEKVIKHASTNQTDPMAPPTVTVTPSGPNSIEVSWGENENDRCAGSSIVCWMDDVHPVEQCQGVKGDGDKNLIIHDLAPCTDYTVTVTVMSPDGNFDSNGTSSSISTPDVRPGPVVDLQVIDRGTDQLTIRCQPPEVDPQCVKEIITTVIEEDKKSLLAVKNTQHEGQKSLRAVKNTQYEETIAGLQPCTNYRVLVTTRSPSGLESEVREVRNTTLDGVPSEPQAFEVTEVTTTSITLQWFRPATNPNCASEYNLTWQDGTDTDTITMSDISTFKVLYTVEGLKPCTEHTFSILAKSSAGAGPEATLKYSTAC